jgi:hypothetical protein
VWWPTLKRREKGEGRRKEGEMRRYERKARRGRLEGGARME